MTPGARVAAAIGAAVMSVGADPGDVTLGLMIALRLAAREPVMAADLMHYLTVEAAHNLGEPAEIGEQALQEVVDDIKAKAR